MEEGDGRTLVVTEAGELVGGNGVLLDHGLSLELVGLVVETKVQVVAQKQVEDGGLDIERQKGTTRRQ